MIVAGVGLVGAGVLLGRSDFTKLSTSAGPGGFRLIAEIPRSAGLSRPKPLNAFAVARAYPAVLPAGKAATMPKAATVSATTTIDQAASTTISSSTYVLATRILPPTSTPIVDECHFATDQFPNYRDLIISEVAWMGTPEDSGNEWIELRNASDTQIDVANYWVLDKSEQIKAHLPTKTLAAGAFYLLERGDDAIPSTTADFVYTGGLSNSNEGLRLFDPSCTLADQIVSLKWPAGNATQKRTMERGGDWQWYTYTGNAFNGILGTPKTENTAPKTPAGQYIPPPVTTTTTHVAVESNPISTEVANVSSATTAAATESTSDETAVLEPEPAAATGGLNHIVISSVQTTGGPGHTTEDYVEFYNPTATQFDLKGFRLVKRTKIGTSDTSLKSWTTDTFIPAGGYYVWANTAYAGSKIADVRTSGSIADDNAVALRQGSEDTGLIVDAVGWGEAVNVLVEGGSFGVNPTAGQMLVRKQWVDTNNNLSDFELR
jgi:hypothetical protein